MSKNRLALHFVAVLVVALFAFLAISSTGSTPQVTASKVESSEIKSNGVVYHLPAPDIKPFDVLGLVFATSVTQFDEKGLEVSNQDGIVTMLLREAQKIGGNDIFNLRVDEKATYTTTQEKTSNGTKTITKKTVTYSGSALAIKYR